MLRCCPNSTAVESGSVIYAGQGARLAAIRVVIKEGDMKDLDMELYQDALFKLLELQQRRIESTLAPGVQAVMNLF